jgi:hypothetical protein
MEEAPEKGKESSHSAMPMEWEQGTEIFYILSFKLHPRFILA